MKSLPMTLNNLRLKKSTGELKERCTIKRRQIYVIPTEIMTECTTCRQSLQMGKIQRVSCVHLLYKYS